MKRVRKVRLLINCASGVGWSFPALRRAVEEFWEAPDTDVGYQFSLSKEDGMLKAARAVQDGVDIVLVVGGDGTVNTVGQVLIGSGVALGVVPVGSGNGFARHFGIPLSPPLAIRALAHASKETIDVGVANDKPFFVTCSMAWDASLVRQFEKWPFRGIIPYLFSAVQEYFEYQPQPMIVRFDNGEEVAYMDPLIFTLANMTQYGGGAIIAPRARPDDGCLELVVVLRRDVPRLMKDIGRLFSGSVDKLPNVESRSCRMLSVRRQTATSIQIDGELVDAPAELHISVLPKALTVLVPQNGRRLPAKDADFVSTSPV
jgi:YegS/Rv2252/BmrU family lipid kinase